MQILYVIASIAAIACVPLLIVIMVQVSGLRSAIREFADQASKGQRASDRGGSLERMNAMLTNILEQIRRVDESVSAIRRTERPDRTRRVADDDRTITPADAAPVRAPVDRTASVQIPPREPSTSRLQPETFQPAPLVRERLAPLQTAPAAHEVPGWRDALRSGVAPTRAAEITDEYRKLIAQPRKADIKRWIDEQGGELCEVVDDGSFQTSRDGTGLLVMITLDETRALILPGGRLVVDFATNFANPLSLRSVTRQTFDLEPDGTGVLRLVEPAQAEYRDGAWRLANAGRLAGLTGD
jgi:hypothetical protein